MKVKSEINQFNDQDVDIIAKTPVFEGFFTINEYQFTHRLFNGQTSDVLSREIFERGNAVAILPYHPKTQTLVFVEQMRIGALEHETSPWLFEVIAGMFDQNEQPEEVAIREAKEEANIDLSRHNLHPIMQYYSSPGGTSEKIYLYLAKIDEIPPAGIFGLESEGEDIKVHHFSLNEALAMIERGQINNAATVISVQWLALNQQKLEQQWK